MVSPFSVLAELAALVMLPFAKQIDVAIPRHFNETRDIFRYAYRMQAVVQRPNLLKAHLS